MQMDKTHSTAGLKPNAAANIGRSAGNTDVPVEKAGTDGTMKVNETSIEKQIEFGKDELEEAIESLREYAGWGNFNIGFHKDDVTDTLVIQITDRDSGEMVHQIPSDQILKLRGHLREVLGLVFDHMA